MNKLEFAKEVGMVASIMADHVSEKLYKKMQRKGTGYIATHEQISLWAVEFVTKHAKTSWEEYLENDIKPLSKEMGSVICWDDCVIDFAFHKLESV